LILRSRRQQTLRLEEPDYKTVAFSAVGLPNFKLDKAYFEGYHDLAKLLCQSSLLDAILDTVASTDSEKVGKSLAVIFVAEKCAISHISNLFRRETNKCASASTLFRNDSVASKVFNHYCKMISLPYLWKTLAYPVNELILLGDKEDSQKKTERDTLVELGSMEVDPNKLETYSEQDLAVNQLQLLLIAQKNASSNSKFCRRHST